MKKETGIAISMGIVFGLVFSFVVILNTQKNQTVTQKQQTQKKTVVTDAGKNASVEPLTVTSPSNGIVVNKNTISLKGTTEKGSFVVIQTQTADLTATATNGDFTVDIPLSLGENIIHISSYPKGTNGKIQEEEIKIYYLTEN